jgi:23S rRNA (pseudouridine1915-N3)-methyltransferase
MMMNLVTKLGFFALLLSSTGLNSTFAFRPIQPLVLHSGPASTTQQRLGISSLSMGMKINIRIVGRKAGSEKWLEAGVAMYETRLRPSTLEVETTWHKDNDALVKGVETDQSKGHSVVLLDPVGKTRTSEQLSDDLYQWLDQGGSRLSLVIGGAEGLPSELKETTPSPQLMSLSALTFTHQFARLMLIEQIYRASEIRKGSGYHK